MTSTTYRMLALWALLAGVAVPLNAGPIRWTDKIEADPQKEYKLHPANGPWLVMAATLHSTGKDGETDIGKAPEEVAHDLVIELRQQKIPAYVYATDGEDFHQTTKDLSGREIRTKNLRVYRSICVLAGNFKSLDARDAQQTLRVIKKLKPKSLEGLDYREAKGGPLAGAFLTTNPLMSSADAAAFSVDPAVLKLNAGERHGLLECRGKYTLVVARFSGRAKVIHNTEKRDIVQLISASPDTLDEAAENARSVATLLRGRDVKICSSAVNFEVAHNLPAFVWHDEAESLVTVGEFESETDPNIRKYLEMFAAPPSDKSNGYDNAAAKFIYLPDKQDKASYIWPLSPKPNLMRVPQHSK